MGYLSEFSFNILPIIFRRTWTSGRVRPYVTHDYYCTMFFLISRLVIITFRFVWIYSFIKDCKKNNILCMQLWSKICIFKIWAERRALNFPLYKKNKHMGFCVWTVMILNYFWLTKKMVRDFSACDFITVQWRKVTNGYLWGQDRDCSSLICLLMSPGQECVSGLPSFVKRIKSEILLKSYTADW